MRDEHPGPIAVPTAYRCLHEGINARAACKPSLSGALLAAKAAGHAHVNLDGTMIYTDLCSTSGPTRDVDL